MTKKIKKYVTIRNANYFWNQVKKKKREKGKNKNLEWNFKTFKKETFTYYVSLV